MDKKGVVLMVGFLAVVGIGSLSLVLLMLEPAKIDKNAKPQRTAINYSGPLEEPAEEAMPAPANWGAAPRNSKKGGSLSFVKKDGQFGGSGKAGQTGYANVSQGAMDAASRGDIGGLLAEARKGGAVPDLDGGGMTDNATRALMQKVVDKVHKLRPKLYKEFLARPSLKRIADDYDRDRDFTAFTRDLAESNDFRKMLKKYYRQKPMRSLSKALLVDRETGKPLVQLFFKHQKDPNMLALVGTYGRGAGLPKNVVSYAEANKTEDAWPDRQTAKKKRRRKKKSYRRRTLKRIDGHTGGGLGTSFGGMGGGQTGGRKPAGGGAPAGGAPPGLNPADLLKNVQKGGAPDPDALKKMMKGK